MIGVRESAVSRRIRDLEDEIGVSLFIRHASGVNLTLAGERFLRRARQAIEQIREGREEAAAIGRAREGHLRIGLFSALASGFLAELFRAFDESHTNIHVDFIDAAAADHVSAIRQFGLDLAFVIGRSRGEDCDELILWKEAVFIALPQAHPLATESEVALNDLVNETFLVRKEGSGSEVRGLLEQRFESFGQLACCRFCGHEVKLIWLAPRTRRG